MAGIDPEADHLQLVVRVERAIMQIAATLRERWPLIDYVYLTPVPEARPRGAPWSRRAASDDQAQPPLN